MRDSRAKSLRFGLLAGALTALLLPLAAHSKPDEPKPKPKPPKLELLTESQQAALSQGKIKIGVISRKGDRVRVKADLVIEGIPEDFHFQLKPQRKPLRDGAAKVSMRLSQRQQEVLAFAEQACMSAEVDARGKVGKRTGTLSAALRKSECV